MQYLESCPFTGSVRLSGGMNNKEGRVEVCFNDVWGSLCDNFWDSSDATVVCNQLGYHGNGTVFDVQ